MPRYFFDVSDGSETVDLTGTEFADPDTARRELVKLAGACIAQNAAAFDMQDTWRFSVRDEHGHELFATSFLAM